MSAMQNSLDMLRAQGWNCLITEFHTNYGRTVDLYGFGDILCAPGETLMPYQTLLVQTTTYDNRLSRVRKIQETPEFAWVKRMGWQVQVHGWQDNDDASKGVEIIDMSMLDVMVILDTRHVGKQRKQKEMRL